MPPSDYNTLEFSSAVVSGAEEFMSQVRYQGDRIFDPEPQSLVTIPDTLKQFTESTDDDPAMGVRAKIIGEPRFKVYGKLMLSVVQLGAPRNDDFYNSFLRAASTLTSLQPRLHQVALQHDLNIETDEIIVHSSAITLTEPTFKEGVELALVPDPEDEATQMFIEIAQICTQAIRGVSRKVGSPQQRWSPVIPFALMPANATSNERKAMIGSLKKQLPVGRLKLGWLRQPMVR